MDILDVHPEVIDIDRYGEYLRGFLSVAGDDDIRAFVARKILQECKLWPDALLHLNPAYERAATVRDLATAGILYAGGAGISLHEAGSSLRLDYRQEDAARKRLAARKFVVPTRARSRKTLTYFLPIFEAVPRGKPDESRALAIVIYLVNALVNSQEQTLEQLARRYEKRMGRPALGVARRREREGLRRRGRGRAPHAGSGRRVASRRLRSRRASVSCRPGRS